MPTIKPKRSPKIKKGSTIVYRPEDFDQHKIQNFYETDKAEDVLALIEPMEFMGMRLISFDTETHPHYKASHLVPPGRVRRWVGSGKKAVPQDYPFCTSVCDGTNAITLYSSVNTLHREMKKLAPLFENPEIDKIAHNFKFDGHMFANADMKIIGRCHDTVVLAKLNNENRTSFELKELAARNEKGITKFEYMVDNYKMATKLVDYRDIPRELLTQYANADVWNCIWVFVKEYTELVEQDGLLDLYNKECEDMMVCYAMERYGMSIDMEYEPIVKNELQVLADNAEAEIYEMAGRTFNINSSAQLYSVLMDTGVNPQWIGRTDKGNPKLDKNALATLERKGVDIVGKILEFRKYEKLLVTYANGIYDQASSEHKVHCNINQTEATTGRMSITKPALQTLPKKDIRIRKAFIPDSDDYTLWFMDLDQIEYRLFVHYAIIPSLIEAIKNGHDIHAATAALIYDMPIDTLLERLADENDKEAASMRSNGKTINFALIYGVGQDHLAELLNVSKSEAAAMKYKYFREMPEAQVFIRQVHAVIKARGYVKNFYGRRRRLDHNDCYKAPNALIQGCAADYIKDRMIAMFKYIMHYNLMTSLRLIVHDEILVHVHKDEQEHIPALRWILSDFTTFRCPITAGAEYGDRSWGEKHDMSAHIGFKELSDMSFMNYNVYDGKIFMIGKETCSEQPV